MTLNWLTTMIRNRDWFGNPVSLSFNKKGGTHNTTIGGLASIAVNCALAFYIYLNFRKLVFYEDDKISTSKSLLQYSEMGEVDARDTNFKFNFVLFDATT